MKIVGAMTCAIAAAVLSVTAMAEGNWQSQVAKASQDAAVVKQTMKGMSNADQLAFVKAVSDGKREFTAIAIAGGKAEQPEKYSYPCGTCRQLMREFCHPKDFKIITAVSLDDYRICTLKELLPDSFGPGNLV